MNPKLTLLILCALSVSALNVFAENKVVDNTTGNLTESDQSYDDSTTSTLAALNVVGDVTYSGTNITLSATNSTGWSNFKAGAGAYVYFEGFNPVLSLADSTISVSGSWGRGIVIGDNNGSGGSSGTLNNVNITVDGASSVGVYVEGYWQASTYGISSLTMTGGTIANHGEGNNLYGIYLTYYCSSTVSGVDITVDSGDGIGVFVDDSTLTLTDSNIHSNGQSLYIFDDSIATVNLHGNTLTGDIRADGYMGQHSTSLTLTADNGSVITGDVLGNTSSTDITLTGVGTKLVGNVSATWSGSIMINVTDGGVITGDIICGDTTYSSSGTIAITLTDAGTALYGNLEINNGAITLTIGADALLAGGGTVSNLIMDTGAILGYTDELTVTTSITIGDSIIIDFSNLTETGNYQVLDWSSASITGGTISEDQFTATHAEGTFSVTDGQLTFNATAVPEPSTWFLIGMGLGTLALFHRRK
ncbi:MAG: PEP-CTERM sorting domain-containing protein [Verrucomicrobiales bacterium]|nr:PEP-CTERM sorting domain-containing protein [Verrucomicrobiales bacterium]